MNIIPLFGLPGGSEWIIILLAILLLFGGRKIPELMRGIGKGIREFNSAKNNVKDEFEKGLNEGEDGDSKTSSAETKSKS